MRALIQRVSEAEVLIDAEVKGKIAQGFLVLLGIEQNDAKEDAEWLARKICALRIFSDENGVMNKSIFEVEGKLLIISQFTLHAKTKKGNRPSFIHAAKPEIAISLYNYFIEQCENQLGKKVETGIFGADMQVALINDGPVSIWIDTKNKE